MKLPPRTAETIRGSSRPSETSGKSALLKSFRTAVTAGSLVAAFTATIIGAPGTATALVADQEVRVTVEEPVGLLGIQVEARLDLGVITAGATSTEDAFGMTISNLGSTGWVVTVVGSDLLSVDSVCGDDGCIDVPNGLDTIGRTNLHVRGGVPASYENEVSAAGGVLSATPLTIMTGSATTFGNFSVDSPPPAVWLDVPAETLPSNYVTTLTYTIMGATP